MQKLRKLLVRMSSFAAMRWARRLAALLVCPLLLLPMLPSIASAQSETLIPISTIQGTGAASTFAEQDVATWGVVTGVTGDGFYLQDPSGDGNPITSDGIFAFTYDAPTVSVGECVQVEAEVAEYFAKTELNWLSVITPSSQCSAGVVTPVVLPPLRPGDDHTTMLESFEGMVVRLNPMTAVVHGPTKRFEGGDEEIAFLPMQWQRYLGSAHLFHDQAEISGLLFLSNELGTTPPLVRWGDWLHVGDGGLVGVLDYNFGKYQLLPLPGQPLTVTHNETTQNTLPPARSDEYGICSFNLHGLGQGSAQFPDAADYAAALRQRAAFIATELVGCTVIALQETGRAQDAHALAETLATEHSLPYSALAIEGAASYEAEFPLTNSILVDSSRVVVELTDAIVGCSPQDYGIVPSGECSLGEFPVFDRPPLMAKLVISGPADAPWQNAQTVWVIDNHWKSKSGDEEANARLRAAQADVVAERVNAILAVDANAQIVVLGDLNDFYGGAAVATLQNATGLFHPYEWLPPLERYTYIFNGAAQVLDHALVTPNLAPQLALVQILHTQADTPTGEQPLAHSDHDPVVLRVRPGGVAAVSGMLQWGEIQVHASDGSGALLAEGRTDAAGEYRLWGLPPGAVTLQISAPEWVVVDEPTQVVDLAAGMGTVTMPQPRHTTAMTGAWLALHTPWLAEVITSR